MKKSGWPKRIYNNLLALKNHDLFNQGPQIEVFNRFFYWKN